jgi:hypothetical protein
MQANTTGRFLAIQRALAVAGYEEVLGLQNSILVNNVLKQKVLVRFSKVTVDAQNGGQRCCPTPNSAAVISLADSSQLDHKVVKVEA